MAKQTTNIVATFTKILIEESFETRLMVKEFKKSILWRFSSISPNIEKMHNPLSVSCQKNINS